MGEHSIIPPSSAHIWGAPNGCTGWVGMSQRYPEETETPEAAEGTASHEVGARMIESAARAGNWINPTDGTDYGSAENGILITEEMVEAAQMYADDVATVMREIAVFGGGNFNVEQHIKAPSIHDLSEGTPDMWLFNPKKGKLYIWDYKYGYGIVEIYENWQLLNYLSGIIDELKRRGVVNDQTITVHMRIIQPRAFHLEGPIREWVINAAELRGYFNILSDNAHTSLSDKATTRSGSHCKHCTARHACPTALKAGVQLYEVAGQPIPVELPLDALGVQLAIVQRAIKQLEYVESGLSEIVKGLIKSGKNVPGYMLAQGVGREKWTKPTSEILSMGTMMGHDLKKPDEACTPNQARNKGIDGAVIMAYSQKPNTGLKLMPDNGNKAKRMFKL